VVEITKVVTGFCQCSPPFVPVRPVPNANGERGVGSDSGSSSRRRRDGLLHIFFKFDKNNTMKTVQLNNAVWKEGNHFVAQCLNIDISSFGDTKEEALANLQEALELYFEDNDNPQITLIEKPEIVGSVLTYA
jgi:predicted RNase H-like HicB family nuclease